MNSRLPLSLPDVSRDVRNLIRGHPLHRFHVAKLPMVRTGAELDRHLERCITMVRGLINAMQHGRTCFRAFQVQAMADRAVLLIQALALGAVGHQSGRGLRD